ncbi:unnamed protein product [Mesocestoides corti]|uniref:LITAF domain-containing protein n=1 Tax=Mesocestoides corti TaxID=53468 RepID=A0A0R3UFG6_MESCO|nr:unnamed protein product [Mesocestoides corti]
MLSVTRAPPYVAEPTIPADPPPPYSSIAQPPPVPPSYVPGTTVVITNAGFGSGSQFAFCPTCLRSVNTQPVYESGVLAWLFCALIFILG